MRIFYFGVWGAGSSGHYLYTPTGYAHACALPWPGRDLDGGLTWNAGAWRVHGASCWRESPTSAAIQGEAALHHKSGWTALSWWDFTGDQRGGCNSAVIVAQVCTFNEILALFAEHFPAQHARQPTLTLMSTLEDGAK